MTPRHISDGITISAVMIKKVPQSPFNQSTKAPDDDEKSVLPAVPIDANNAYCVAVYVLSTKADINPTKATVAKDAAKSSSNTVIANKTSLFPTQDKTVNIKFVKAIIIPDVNIALISPILIVNKPPNNVKKIVVNQPIPFE